MAKLQGAVGVQVVTFLGRGDPFPYDAGVMGGTAFPAGNSLRVVVGLGDLDYQELKVKGADFDSVWPAIKDLGRGTQIEITYRPAGQFGPAQLVAVKVPAQAKG